MEIWEIVKLVGAGVFAVILVMASFYQEDKKAFDLKIQLPFLIVSACVIVMVIVTKNSPLWDYAQMVFAILFAGYGIGWIRKMYRKANPKQ